MEGAKLMTSATAASIWRAVRRVSPSGRGAVHFHVDDNGRAFACDYFRCDSPGLNLREAMLTETGARRPVR